MPPDRAELREISTRDVVSPPVMPRSQRRVVLITGTVMAIAVALFGAYNFMNTQKTAARLMAPRPPTPIEVVTAETIPVPQFLSGIGTIQAVHQVTVAAEVGGRVTQVFFEPGATVKAGDPLIQLNDAPERGDLANFQAQARLAGVNLNRDKTLSAQQFQSLKQVDQTRTLLDQAQANIAKIEAQIAQKLIRAPFSGKLGVRQIEVGGYMMPGGAIVTLTDLSTLWANFSLPEQMASQLHVGQATNIRADAYPDRVFEAKITTIEPQISAQTRTILVQATLPNADQVLLPGMFAKAEVVLPTLPSAVAVPETAIDYSLYGDSVFVVRQDGTDKNGKPVMKVQRSFVKTGDHVNGKVVILSGAKAGDVVAASGQLNLSNNTVVSVQAGDTFGALPSIKKY